MDQGTALVVVSIALVTVVTAWVAREIVGVLRRRQAGDDRESSATDLVPLLLLPVTALVRRIGRDRRSIESLVGPDGTVSLMFCDIEGSTRINRRLGDEAWVRVLGAHDQVVETTVRRHGGKVVKTQGDGCMAAFRTPGGAVGAAVSLGPALESCETITVALPVRVGVHTGRVVAEKGDLFGTNVTMAARVAAAARGDEVLVSEAVQHQLAGSDDLAFRRRRPRRLKGLAGRHRLYSVTPDGTDEVALYR